MIPSTISEKICNYKGELYSVRSDGMVKRHARKNAKVRALDGKWTLGKKNESNGYMHIGAHRVHIIVATAFYGAKDSSVYVVDHIDTNRCNNRVDNLRWVTRLENALLNPVTRKRIEYACGGDILKFINDPSCIRISEANKDLHWMRTVSATEAKLAYNNVMHWAYSSKHSNRNENVNTNSIWMFDDHNRLSVSQQDVEFVKAEFPETALQKDWYTPTAFPCCPTAFHSQGLREYFENLGENVLFAKNKYQEQRLLYKALIKNDSELLVCSVSTDGDTVKPYGLTKILFSGGQFVHESKGTYLEENGVLKAFTEMQGKVWTGGDSIDNYC
ncbi:MAG: HNH endonuclease [Paludibacteraceae bacterium]|nr:HNH endonuclease [Paludibacteraceae bacterium]